MQITKVIGIVFSIGGGNLFTVTQYDSLFFELIKILEINKRPPFCTLQRSGYFVFDYYFTPQWS
jgi:hypothetical protein